MKTEFSGPFRIIDRIVKLSYRLQLPNEWKPHNVFHISLLKQSNANEFRQVPLKNKISISKNLMIQFMKLGESFAGEEWRSKTNISESSWCYGEATHSQKPRGSTRLIFLARTRSKLIYIPQISPKSNNSFEGETCSPQGVIVKFRLHDLDKSVTMRDTAILILDSLSSRS